MINHKTCHSYLQRYCSAARYARMVTISNVTPPDPNRLDDPAHWLEKADEARTKAEEMRDAQAREMMLRVVREYEELAKRAELRNREMPDSA
jgi:hypothetical protein